MYKEGESLTGKYDLRIVKQKILAWRNGAIDSGWFSAPKCSVEYVVFILQCDFQEAQNIIFDGILKLDNTDFAKSVVVWGDVADEYGLENYLGHNWYVKFLIDSDGVLDDISFHPCERDMNLADGRTLISTIEIANKPNWRKK